MGKAGGGEQRRFVSDWTHSCRERAAGAKRAVTMGSVRVICVHGTIRYEMLVQRKLMYHAVQSFWTHLDLSGGRKDH